MQEQITLSELKQAWFTRLETFAQKSRDYTTFMSYEMDLIDLNVDDLINPVKEEKIEREINKIIDESTNDPKIAWPIEMKKEYLKENPTKMNYVNSVKDNLDTIRPEPLNLATLLADKELVKADDIDKAVANISLHSFKDVDHKAKLRPIEKNYILNPLPMLKEKEKSIATQLAFKQDLILNVTLYHSFTGKKSQEFIVLGSQKLSALKDKVYCVSDHLEEKADTSSFFFINNTFYNDMRLPTSTDMSKQIIETQDKKLKRRLAEQDNAPSENEFFKAQTMHETKFEDLEIVLGKPYLYRHQNSCDHLFIFNDVRLKDHSDLALEQLYPINVFQNRIKRKRCDGCFTYFAKIMCFNDKMQPQDPSYFCEKCYVNLHQDPQKKLKVKNFQVYLYIHE